MGSSPYNIKHMVNNVTCSVKHFERTDTLEIHEHGELTFTVALERGRSQDKSSSAAAADFSLMCFPLLLLLNDMLVFLMTASSLHFQKSFHVARSVNAA